MSWGHTPRRTTTSKSRAHGGMAVARYVIKWVHKSGRGAAWLARLLGVQEVPGSNPGSPTTIPHRLTARIISFQCVLESNWSPLLSLRENAVIPRREPPALSTLIETRQTRQIVFN